VPPSLLRTLLHIAHRSMPAAASAACRVLVTFEVRADNIARDSVLEAARAKFSRIRQLERSQLPAGYQVEHVEVYELML
jgi:hypothetical protein